MARRLTLDETSKCLRAWKELRDQDALTLLITCNRGLVIYCAKKYLGHGLTLEELISAGNEGLINAINKFNYEKIDMQFFSAYIGKSIENAIIGDLRQYNKHCHVLSFDQPMGQSKDGDEQKIEDIIGTDAEELIENVIADMKIDIVRNALQCLTSREKQIILLRYGLDDAHKKTLEEVAEIFGCSVTNIAKQEKKALTKMRHPRITRKIKDFID